MSWILLYIFCLMGVPIALYGFFRKDFNAVGFGLLWTLLVYGMMGREHLHNRACFRSQDIKTITIAGVELPDDASEAVALEGLRKYQPGWDDSRGGFPVFVCRLILTHEDGTRDFFRLECLPDDPHVTVAALDDERTHINLHGDEGIAPDLLAVLRRAGAKLPYPDSKLKVLETSGDKIGYHPDTVNRTDEGISVFIRYPSNNRMAVLATFNNRGEATVVSGWDLRSKLNSYKEGYKRVSEFPPLEMLLDELKSSGN